MPVKDFHVMYAFVSIWLTKYEMKHPEPDEMSANKILASNAFPCDRTNLFAFIQGSKGGRERERQMMNVVLCKSLLVALFTPYVMRMMGC